MMATSKFLRDSLLVNAVCQEAELTYYGIFLKNNQRVYKRTFAVNDRRAAPRASFYTRNKGIIELSIPDSVEKVGQFLGVVHGLALLKKRNLKMPVYTDSFDTIQSIRTGRMVSFSLRSQTELLGLVRRAEGWLKNNRAANRPGDRWLLQWNKYSWGELPKT